MLSLNCAVLPKNKFQLEKGECHYGKRRFPRPDGRRHEHEHDQADPEDAAGHDENAEYCKYCGYPLYKDKVKTKDTSESGSYNQ